MPQRPPRAALLIAAAVALAALFAAIGVGTTSSTGGGATGHPAILRAEGTLAVVFLGWLAVVAVALAIWALTMRGAGPPVHMSERRRMWPVFVVMALLAIGFRLWLHFGKKKNSTLPNLRIPSGTKQPRPTPHGHAIVDTGLATIGILVAIALTVLVLIVLNHLDKRRRGQPTPVPDVSDDTTLAAAVAAALADLAAEPDPRRAVIAAYARMERVLADRGMPRRPWEAPVEYVDRVLRSLGANGTAVDRLTELFEIAEFSRHPVDETMRTEAIAALERVRDAAEVGA